MTPASWRRHLQMTGPTVTRLAHACAGKRWSLPSSLDLETTSVIRRRLLVGTLDARRARLALTDLVELPLRRAPHRPLLARCWELRENITVYDAVYVALAELLDTVLLTADARLANAPGPRCRFESVVAPQNDGRNDTGRDRDALMR